MTPWTVAYQAPLSMGLSRQEYWSGLPFLSPGLSSQPRDRTRVSCIVGRHFYHLSPQKDLYQHTTTPRTDVFSVLHPTAGRCRPTPPPRLLDSHRQVWPSLLWGHCSFLLSRTAICILLKVSASQMIKLALSILQRLANKSIKPVLYLAAYPILY